MNPFIAEKIYLFLTYLRGEKISPTLNLLIQNEKVDSSEMEQIKVNKAKSLLIYARQNVPFYRNNYDFNPDEIKSLTIKEFNEYWKSIPLLSKSDVLNNIHYFLSDKLKDMKTHYDKTSGSTGTPLFLKVNTSCWTVRHARDLQVKEWFGIRNGEKYALFWGQHWSNKSKREIALKDFLLNRIRISAFNQEEKYLEESFKRIKKFKPTFIMGYPSAITDFCSFIKAKNCDLSFLKLKAVITTAEPLRNYQRKIISEICNCSVFSQYGGAEQGFVACECEKGGFHIFSDTTWLEDENGEMKPNTLTEAIATDLELYSMPLIRYRTGDEVIFKEGKCSCGRTYPLLERVEGRSGEDIILPNGKKINANLPSYIFKEIASMGVIRRYRFVDKKDGMLYLYIIPTQKFNQEVLNLVEKETQNAFGKDIQLKIEITNVLENLPNAKHKDYVVINE